jgi:hypothetical protein
MNFRYVAYRSVFAADHPGARIRVNGSPVGRLDRFFAPGTSIDLSVDSVQVDETARTRFDFLSWSDGGGRSHRLTAGERPDTAIARVAPAYRLQTTVQGAPADAVTAAVPGDISTGVYLAEGTLVSLRAVPQSAAVFVGWSGDTTATSDTLTLPMRHPFDLMASFVAVQNVVLGSAADALFGTGVLRSEEAAYLDAAGNRDGIYDLGDFLAAADRSDGPVPAQAAIRSSRNRGHS